LEYTAGAGGLSISLRFINVVPLTQSPVLRAMNRIFGKDLGLKKTFALPPEGICNKLEETEDVLISLYRSKECSPWDVTETGWTHSGVTRFPIEPLSGVWTDLYA
jgi:hypothetical protein